MVNLPGGYAGGSEKSFHTTAFLENRLIKWKITAKFFSILGWVSGAVLDMKVVRFQETRSSAIIRSTLISDRLSDFFLYEKHFDCGSIIDGTAMINCCAVPLFVPYYLDEKHRNSLIHIKKIVLWLVNTFCWSLLRLMIGWKVKEVENGLKYAEVFVTAFILYKWNHENRAEAF